ncbi:hypothetical protein QBC47DRAFT_76 [Echria macrotheca]|uniref:Uncharacterized protein n=1 Tax=Echria macrotheca TaxID=438768 RepID=A0AAJ0F9B8_9PEZI|nr:hypothetical protein QBC47DRAFT_76 [Echria macrotheca]
MAVTFSDSAVGLFTLPPQTTPFAPAATAAAAACNSRSRSVFCFATAGQLSRGYACDLVDSINTSEYQYLNAACYPPHYDLVNHGEPDLDRTLAYPGTACPAGFTPACTTTLTLAEPTAKPDAYSATLTQTWCCPRPATTGSGNDWVCTDRDQLAPTSRLCMSLVAANTKANVWLSAAGTRGTPAYTTSAVGPEMSVRVLRAAFPLGEVRQEVLDGLAGLAVPAATEGGGGAGNQTATPTTTAAASGGGSGSNAGMIAGIVVGCLALLGFIATGIYLCVCYKREGKRVGKDEEVKRADEVESRVEPGGQRPAGAVGLHRESEKSKGDVVEYTVGELPASSNFQPTGRFAEMGSDTGVVELPTEYHKARETRI